MENSSAGEVHEDEDDSDNEEQIPLLKKHKGVERRGGRRENQFGKTLAVAQRVTKLTKAAKGLRTAPSFFGAKRRRDDEALPVTQQETTLPVTQQPSHGRRRENRVNQKFSAAEGQKNQNFSTQKGKKNQRF